MRRLHFFISAVVLLIGAFIYTGCERQSGKNHVERWGIHEIVLDGPSSGNPYMDVTLTAVFLNGNTSVTVPGFYDGNGIYRIRFSPDVEGSWSYQTESNLSKLSGFKGKFLCVPPAEKNHGPIEIVNTYYLRYADGTPFYAVGTTAYQWTSVNQLIQDKTVKTLADAPFNKIRMCFFPKSYQYGNDTEPWIYPFRREDGNKEFDKPNCVFFRNFENRVKELMEMGIQADVILFHPYDAWGYSKMGKEGNEKYVRYMIARLSAYRNVWWSLANEWDVPSIKDSIDWEGIGTLLQREDPHHRLRGIHNWYDTEDHFYDHTKPWITHVSAQTSHFNQALRWREKYKKPLLFDEMRYEGDVPSGWGNLSGQEMTSYFWMAGLSGGFGTHGETFRNTADDSTEVRWWAKGGELVGESPERIRFFRSVMEQAPVQEMIPEIIDQGDQENPGKNIYLLSKPGAYYLAYVADAGQVIKIGLEGDAGYRLDIIDTWNMKVMEQRNIESGKFQLTTEFPFTAVRIYRE
jgi:hypothetical protein